MEMNGSELNDPLDQRLIFYLCLNKDVKLIWTTDEGVIDIRLTPS